MNFFIGQNAHNSEKYNIIIIKSSWRIDRARSFVAYELADSSSVNPREFVVRLLLPTLLNNIPIYWYFVSNAEHYISRTIIENAFWIDNYGTMKTRFDSHLWKQCKKGESSIIIYFICFFILTRPLVNAHIHIHMFYFVRRHTIMLNTLCVFNVFSYS